MLIDFEKGKNFEMSHYFAVTVKQSATTRSKIQKGNVSQDVITLAKKIIQRKKKSAKKSIKKNLGAVAKQSAKKETPVVKVTLKTPM